MTNITTSGTSRNPIGSTAPLDMLICVGFGTAQILKDEVIFFDEEMSEEIESLQKFEDIAKESPNSNWQCVMEAPLWDATWERNNKGQWVCIKSGIGFA